jgi:mycobactin peptide synthetase MbtE
LTSFLIARLSSTRTILQSAMARRRGLSYRELAERADATARLLRGRGVCRETFVGVLAEPSVELLAAILGVMKAGGAYIPLDPNNPVQRSALLVQDSGARIVLAQRRFADRLPVPAVVIEDAQGGAGQPRACPPVHPEDPACLIYTSCSTGRPKGVVLTHHGLANLAFAAAARLQLGSGDRFLQLAAIGFSAFLEEVFPGLLCGATVVMAGYQRALPSTDAFLDLLAHEAITSFEITTARWHELVDDMCRRGLRFPSSVRIVLMGGELALPERVAAWARFGIPLVHVYGPTETTATATYYDLPVAAADTWANRCLPIPHHAGRLVSQRLLRRAGLGGGRWSRRSPAALVVITPRRGATRGQGADQQGDPYVPGSPTTPHGGHAPPFARIGAMREG